MEPTTTEQPAQEAQSSVEITRGVKGDYGWKLKSYTGSPLPDLSALYLYDDALKQRFVAKPPELADQLEQSLAARRGQGGAE
jgi:hypothetical protein